ncbi:MAG: hypothetical protein AAFN93_13050 [Bacteroidota bacterium]
MISRIINWLRSDAQVGGARPDISRHRVSVQSRDQRAYNPEIQRLTLEERLEAIQQNDSSSRQEYY